MAYSFAQLEGLWEQAGGSHALAPVMAAIALAESRGNPNATGGVGEKGLWQINPHAWGSLATYDPLGNAKAAVHVESVQGLGAWTTYTSGAYRKFLGSAKAVTPPASGTGQAPGTTTAAGRGSGAGTAAPGVGAGLSGKAPASGGLWGWLQAVWTGVQVGSAQTEIGQDTGAVATLASTFGGLGAIAQSIVGLSAPFVKAGEALDWFFVPGHWVRILSGVGGVGLVAAGLYSFSDIGGVSQPLSVQGTTIPQPTGDMALALGIGEVGLGAVLLSVAFHNVPSSVTTFGEFLGFLQGKASTAVSATTSPAAAATTAASTEAAADGDS